MPRNFRLPALNNSDAATEPERVACARCSQPSTWAIKDRDHLCAGCCQLREPEGRQQVLPFDDARLMRFKKRRR